MGIGRSPAQAGLPLGVVLSSMVIRVVRLGAGDECFLGWGWRIPFLASAVLVVAALLGRVATTRPARSATPDLAGTPA